MALPFFNIGHYCLPILRIVGFPCGSAGKESACNAGNMGSIPGLGRSPGDGKGYPLQYSGLKNSIHGVYSPWGRKGLDMTERLSFSQPSCSSLSHPVMLGVPGTRSGSGLGTCGMNENSFAQVRVLSWTPGTPTGSTSRAVFQLSVSYVILCIMFCTFENFILRNDP